MKCWRFGFDFDMSFPWKTLYLYFELNTSNLATTNTDFWKLLQLTIIQITSFICKYKSRSEALQRGFVFENFMF